MQDTQIEVGLTMTMNLGNFESLKIDSSLRDYPRQKPGGGVETPKEAYERIFNFVNARLEEKVKIVRAEKEEEDSRGGY